MFRRVWAGFLALLLVVGMVAAMPVPAAAAMSEEDYLAAARQLNKYGLVQGDDRGYRFYAQITRAEMAKLLVYSLGLQSEASRYVGRGTFSDTTGHWADGIIGVAKARGIMKGYPEGDFRPQNALTYAEVITALSRLVGLEAGGEPWPRTYLEPATQAGIIPFEMDVHRQLNDPASRGDVFVLLWRTLTVVKNAQGQNMLRRYLDSSAPSITVDPQPKETTDLTLTVSGTAKDASQVLINGTPVTLTFGYFRHDVSLRLGPNTIRIQAVDDAGNLKEEVLQITRKVSPVNAVTLTGPATVKVGQTGTFTITVRDQNGEAVTDRKGVTAEVSPPGLGTFDAVTGVFTAGTVPGSGTIIVKTGSAQSSLAVTVTAGDLHHIKIDPEVSEVDPKQMVAFSVKGYDAYENPVPVGAAQWSASGGTITSNTGVYTAPDRISSSYTITAVAGGKTATARVQPRNARAASVRITQPTASLKANGISELTLTATVLDAQGNTLTDYIGDLSVSSAQPGVANPTQTTVPVVQGVAQIPVRAGVTAGTAQIKAQTNLTVYGTAAVTVQPQRLQSVRLVGQAVPTSTGAYPTGYVEAIALDEDGNPMRTALTQPVVIEVSLTISGSAGGNGAWFTQNDQNTANIALGPLDPATGDVRTRTHIQYNRGVGTMLIEGTALGSTSWVQVQSGALRADQVGMPARVEISAIADTVAGQTRSIYVEIKDADGYRVTQPSLLNGFFVTLKDQNGITYTGVSNPLVEGYGRWRFDVTQTIAGTYTYTAALQPGGATTSLTAKVIPSSIDRVVATATPATIQTDNSSQATIQAKLVDVNGNVVTDGSYKVTFHLQGPSTGALQPFADQEVMSVNGVAQITVRAGTVRAWDDILITVANPPVPLAPVTVRVTTRGVPDRLVISYGDNSGNGTAGDAQDHIGRAGTALVVYVDVYDRFGDLATYDNGRQVTLRVRDTQQPDEAGTTLNPVTTSSGRAIFYVNRPTTGTFALKAESAGLTPAMTMGYGGSVPDVVIEPAHTLRLTVAPDLPVLRPGGGLNYALVTATLLDVSGNPVANQTGRPVTVTLEIQAETNGTTALGRFTTNDLPDGTTTLKRSVEIPPGASVSNAVKFFSGSSTGEKSITWRAQDGTSGSFRMTTAAATDVNSLSVIAEPAYLEPWTVGAPAVTGQTVTVTVRGTDGHQISSANGSVTLTMKDADTRIVAIWRPDTKRWESTYSGGAYPTTVQAPADRGRALVRVRANGSGMKLYEASYPNQSGQPVTAQANGMFYPNGAEYLVVTPSALRIDGNDIVTLVASVRDRFGNLVNTAVGNVTFRLPAGAPGSFLDPYVNVPLAGGQAQTRFQADGVFRNTNTSVPITVETTVPNPLTNSFLTQTVTLVVDDAAPRVTGVTFRSSAAGTPNSWNEDDEIVLQFDGPINPATFMPGLSPTTPVNAGLGTIQFTPTQITVTGVPGLGTIKFSTGANGSFNIKEISIDPTSMKVTIKLGTWIGGTSAAYTAGGTTAEVTPAAPVQDDVGNAANGPFTSVPVQGNP